MERRKAGRKSGQNVLDDLSGRFGPGIVARHDGDIGVRGRFRQQRPFRDVPVPAGPEDTQDLPVASQRLQTVDHATQRIVRVRVIDERMKRLPVVNSLKPTGDAVERPEARADGVHINSIVRRHGDDGQAVRDVVAAGKRGFELEPLSINDDDELRTAERFGDDFCSDIGLRFDSRCGDATLSSTCHLDKSGRTRIVRVDDNNALTTDVGKNASLRGLVAVEVLVIIEVILCDVRNHGAAEACSGNPILIQPR